MITKIIIGIHLSLKGKAQPLLSECKDPCATEGFQKRCSLKKLNKWIKPLCKLQRVPWNSMGDAASQLAEPPEIY